MAVALADRAERVSVLLAENSRCQAVAEAAALQQAVVAAINARRVPGAFQEPLASAANDLAARVGACTRPGVRAERGRERKEPKHRGRGKHKHEHDG